MTPTPEIHLPLSKSIGARFLMASYFAGTLAHQPRMDDCDDLRVIQQALLDLSRQSEATSGLTPALDIHASGTAFRFVTAATASSPGADFFVTGTPRLCSRPMLPLIDVLRQAGASIEAQGENHTGPYHIVGKNLKGGEFSIRGDVSSQFISALMLVSPTWEKGMRLHFSTPLVSRPYAEMTAAVMRRFGISVDFAETGVEVNHSPYKAPDNYRVEPDWSAAGFFYAAALLSGREINIAGLISPGKSLQGDAATADIFNMLGLSSLFSSEGAILRSEGEVPDEVEIDMTDTPDLTPALAVACAGKGIRFLFTGVRNLRVKESDRLAVLQSELGKLGFIIEIDDDSIAWKGEMKEKSTEPIATFDDHRIAMAFSMMAFPEGRIEIENPDVVEKSFENFWHELPAAGLSCRHDGKLMIVERLVNDRL